MPQGRQDSVWQTARRLSLDWYLSALLAPRPVRDDLMTLAAFKGELESIPLRISEPLIGEIRLQWWRDAMAARGKNTNTGNPLADSLLHVIEKYKLNEQSIKAMIDAQIPFVYAEPTTNRTEFSRGLGLSDGNAFKLAACITEPNSSRNDQAHKTATTSAGHAYGTARLLSQLRGFASRGAWPLPIPSELPKDMTGLDLVADKHHASERRLSVVQAIAAARMARETALSYQKSLSKPAKLALLPLALVEPYFKAFERAKGDPLLMEIDVPPVSRRFALLRAYFGNFG